MLLFDLPPEIILIITDHLDDAGVNALTRTHSQMYDLLNEHLYLRDMINPYETRSLAWAVRSCAEDIHSEMKTSLDIRRRLSKSPQDRSCATCVEDVTTKKNTVQWALYAVRHLKPMPANLHRT